MLGSTSQGVEFRVLWKSPHLRRGEAQHAIDGDLERTDRGVEIDRGALLLGPHELHVQGVVGNDPLRETTALTVQLKSPEPALLIAVAGYTGFIPQGATTIDIEANASPEGIRLETLAADLGEARLRASGLISVAGDLAGPINYVYQRGPDGRQYAVGGSVGIQASVLSGDPAEAARKAGRLAAAANAATNPSAQDYAAARQAYALGSQLGATPPPNENDRGLSLSL